MKPAICVVCKTSAIQSPNGDWVTFSDYKSLDGDQIGHPEGLEWFCEIHIEEAKSMSDRKSSIAIEELCIRYPATPDNDNQTEKKQWWQRVLGR